LSAQGELVTVTSEIELVKPAELKGTSLGGKEMGQSRVKQEEAQLVTVLDVGNGEEMEKQLAIRVS
jgi:hypothetical protein